LDAATDAEIRWAAVAAPVVASDAKASKAAAVRGPAPESGWVLVPSGSVSVLPAAAFGASASAAAGVFAAELGAAV
jgi:hypothetical protein